MTTAESAVEKSSTRAKHRVIELRFFGGLSVEEAAMVLKISEAKRDTRLETRQSLAAA